VRYRRIELNPKPLRSIWEASCYLDEEDRVEGDSYPHSAGFYYSPETETTQKGFAKLKSFLVKKHEDEIARLQRSLVKLKEANLSKKVTDYDNRETKLVKSSTQAPA
jgi:hypothetical protein